MVKPSIENQSRMTQARLRELVHYDPATGLFIFKKARGHKKAGARCGSVGQAGYVKMCLDGMHFLGHRVAFLYMTGEWPPHEIDHKDGTRSNNAWENLRPATTVENRQNLPPRKSNKSGLPGAYRTSDGKRWRSRIRSNGAAIFLGNFASAEEAHAAYLEAKARLHTFNPTVRGLSPIEQTG